MTTVPNGFVQRNAYYTAAELANPALETSLRRDHPVRCDNGETFVRRDIRWYRPTVPGGERCAAVVHTAVCRGTALVEAATAQARASLIALEPEATIPPHCGAAPSDRRGQETYREREARQLVRTSGARRCRRGSLTPVDQVRMWSDTRFGVRTVVDSALGPDVLPADQVEFLRRAPETILGTAAYAAGERQPQFMQSGRVSQQGRNIALEQRVVRSGRGYCISLTARQGDRVWRRAFVRPDGISPVAADREWQSASALLRDAHALARAFRAALAPERRSARRP